MKNVIMMLSAILVLIIVFIGMLWLMDVAGPTQKQTTVTTVTHQLLSAANLHQTRIGTYDGVCEDIGVGEPYQCRDEDTGVLIFSRISSGSYYCGDSSGFRGEVHSLPNTGVSCVARQQ